MQLKTSIRFYNDREVRACLGRGTQQMIDYSYYYEEN